MAKRLNKNLVATLSFVGFGSVIGVSYLVLDQLKSQDPKYFVELAEISKQRGDWPQANLYYQEAYKISRDAQYLIDKGEMLLADGDRRLASAAYNEAITNSPERSPQRLDAYTKELELKLSTARWLDGLGHWDRVRRVSDELLKEDGLNAFGMASHGLALTKLTSQDVTYAETGLEELKDACRLAPEKLEYVLDLIDRYVDLSRQADFDSQEEKARSMADHVEALMADSLMYFSRAQADAGRVAWADVARLRWELGWHLAVPERFNEADALFAEAISIGDQAPAVKDRVAPRVHYARFISLRWSAKGGNSAIDPLFIQADALLRESISQWPDDFDAYVQRADNLIAVGDFEEAVKVCETRIELGFDRRGLDARLQQRGYANLLFYASRASFSIAVHPGNSAGEKTSGLKRAEEFIDRASGEYPDSPLITSQVARIKLAHGDDRGALKLYAKADAQFQDQNRLDWDTKRMLARLHLSLKAPGAAIKVLAAANEMAKATPAYFEYWILYAQAHLDTNQYEQAIELVTDNVLRIEPENQLAMKIRVKALFLLGRDQEASAEAVNILGAQKSQFIFEAERRRVAGDIPGMLSQLQEALRLDPTDRKLLEMTARLLITNGQREAALVLVDKALEVEPNNKAFQRIRISVLPDLSFEERVERIKAIIESEEDEYTRVTELAQFHYNRRELEKVLPLLDRAEALLLAPDFVAIGDRKSEKALHRDVLTTKMRTAAYLDDQQALSDAADSATRHNVDGVNGSTFRGQYHMYREEIAQAIVAFNEALSQQPNDVQALCYLGRCYHAQVPTRSADAQACFEKAVLLNPNSFLAHKGLAQLAFKAGELAQYRREIEECRRVMSLEGRNRRDDWVNARILELKEEENPGEAITRREASLPDPPPDPENEEEFFGYQMELARLAQLHEKVENWPAAEQYYRLLRVLRPDDRNRTLALSGLLMRAQEPDDALVVLTEYRDARQSDEDRAIAMLPIAAFHVRMENTEEAGRVLRQAADLTDALEVVYALGQFYLRAAAPRQALPWFARAIEKARATGSPRLSTAMSARIGCLLHEGLNDIDGARQYVSEYRVEFPDDPTGFYWQAELHAKRGEIRLAIEALTRYLDVRPHVAFVRYERARRYLALGRTPQAIQDLNMLIRDNPKSTDLQPDIMLARIYQESGKIAQARVVREAMVHKAPDSVEAVTELVKDYLDASALSDAENLLASRINRDAANPKADWFFLRAHVSSRLNDNDRVIADLKRGVELSGFDPVRVATILDWFVQLKVPEQGVTYYQQHKDRVPRVAALLARYGLLLARADRPDEAVHQFRLAMGLALKEGFGSIRTVHSTLRMAFTLDDVRNRLASASIQDPVLSRVNERLLLNVLIGAGMTAEADAKIKKLLQGSQSDAERAGLFAEQGMMYQMGNRFDNACEAYEEALKYDPNHALVLNNLAFILSDELKRHETAIRYAERAVELHPMPEVIDTLGWIHVRMGNCKQGIADLSRALKADSSLPILWYHLGDAYRRCGEFDVAVNVLNTGLRVAQRTQDQDLIADITTARRRAAKNDDTP